MEKSGNLNRHLKVRGYTKKVREFMTEFQNSGNFVVLNSFQPMQVENPNFFSIILEGMPQEPPKWSRTHERA